jgi:hypothetical protein
MRAIEAKKLLCNFVQTKVSIYNIIFRKITVLAVGRKNYNFRKYFVIGFSWR